MKVAEEMKRRYWLAYVSLDTLDDFVLLESQGNDVTEEMVNDGNETGQRLKVMELPKQKFDQIKNDPTNRLLALVGDLI